MSVEFNHARRQAVSNTIASFDEQAVIAIERYNREIRRRTRVVDTLPDDKSALILVAARLKYVADSEWGSRRYLDASLLKEQSC